jgi:predicted N-acetyltransferase YhbS
VTACFVAREISSGRIAGYYTLAAGGILLRDLPAELAKRLPRYPTVPVARLGRLAVALGFQGRGLGGALLWDALARAARSEVAVYSLVVDAKDQEAERFYRHHGFVLLADRPQTLFLPLPKK